MDSRHLLGAVAVELGSVQEELMQILGTMDVLDSQDAPSLDMRPDLGRSGAHLGASVAPVVDKHIQRRGDGGEEVVPHSRVTLISNGDGGPGILKLLCGRGDVQAVHVALGAQNSLPHEDRPSGLHTHLSQRHWGVLVPGQVPLVGPQGIVPLPNAAAAGHRVIIPWEGQPVGVGGVGGHVAAEEGSPIGHSQQSHHDFRGGRHGYEVWPDLEQGTGYVGVPVHWGL
mmetsp:Transcript_43489/g.94734  ORF Transcript_43489/g.94734 Transcript_43489/m.94734 type:complete len:227 (-) Transcript_43489:37-717(-)